MFKIVSVHSNLMSEYFIAIWFIIHWKNLVDKDRQTITIFYLVSLNHNLFIAKFGRNNFNPIQVFVYNSSVFIIRFENKLQACYVVQNYYLIKRKKRTVKVYSAQLTRLRYRHTWWELDFSTRVRLQVYNNLWGHICFKKNNAFLILSPHTKQLLIKTF